MFFASLATTLAAVAQVFILGAIGYYLLKKRFLSDNGLDLLSKLVLGITLPTLIFSQILSRFSFRQYPYWWIFPLLSIAITAVGLAAGRLLSSFITGERAKAQFVSLVAFQNSGYLPLVLLAALLPKEKAETMFIYLFLFLIGFNLLMFSLGVHILNPSKPQNFKLSSLLNPPVVAALAGLFAVLIGMNKIAPEFVIRPLRMLGDCTLPLAALVVGGNLAQIKPGKIFKKEVSLLLFTKLILLPLLGLLLVLKMNLPELIGLLIIIELAVPSAMNLSVIIRHYKQEDLLVSQGVFFSHILSLLTLPIFLSIYFAYVMIK